MKIAVIGCTGMLGRRLLEALPSAFPVLAVLFVFAYALKREYWKDIH